MFNQKEIIKIGLYIYKVKRRLKTIGINTKSKEAQILET